MTGRRSFFSTYAGAPQIRRACRGEILVGICALCGVAVSENDNIELIYNLQSPIS
jgi:hypothetical protein